MAEGHSDPYAEKREYRAVAMLMSDVGSLRDVLSLVSPARIGRMEYILTPRDNCQMLRCGYFAPKPYRTTPESYARAIRTTWRGKTAYRYDMYGLQSALPEQTVVVLLAAPLAEMASDVFEAAGRGAVGKDLRYLFVDLHALLTWLQSDNADEDIRVSSVRFRVDGDPPMENIVLSGRWWKSIIGTDTYRHARQLSSPATVPVRARITHKQSGERAFCLWTSARGYMRFNIGTQGRGMLAALRVLMTLHAWDLAKTTTASPLVEE